MEALREEHSAAVINKTPGREGQTLLCCQGKKCKSFSKPICMQPIQRQSFFQEKFSHHTANTPRPNWRSGSYHKAQTSLILHAWGTETPPYPCHVVLWTFHYTGKQVCIFSHSVRPSRANMSLAHKLT